MEYVSALVPPVVMAIAFTALIRVLIKSQGGANKAKEDGVVDAMVRAREAGRSAGATAVTTAGAAPRQDGS